MWPKWRSRRRFCPCWTDWACELQKLRLLIIWLIYTLFLHLRAIRGWRGRPVAVLAIVGCVVVLFTFLGVGWLARRVGLESLHVY